MRGPYGGSVFIFYRKERVDGASVENSQTETAGKRVIRPTETILWSRAFCHEWAFTV